MRLSLFLAFAGCSGPDDPPDTGTPATAPAYTVLGSDDTLPAAALLSIWGSDVDDVWIAGADDGAGPVVLHFDGTGWSRIDTGTTGDLWWVWGDGQGKVFFSGVGGRVVVHDVGSGAFVEEAAADPAITLFGVWGTSATDVWTVGGDIISGTRDGVMSHFDGAEWAEVATAPKNGTTPRQSFKVWGRSSDELWVVGTQAYITEWDGAAFTAVDPAPVYETTPLTTVHGDATQVIAVGGFGNAAVARNDGTGWVNDSPPPGDLAPAFNGVFLRDGTVVACGVRGAIWSRSTDGWAAIGEAETMRDFHACWIDPMGQTWAVGGDLTTLGAGVVATTGDAPPITL